ncbi:MAG: helix-turn-helix transcriptional regulator [Fibrobacter sp.]|nr:helix-turn-helix transcriptional regulator [Fibrobacter sp.]
MFPTRHELLAEFSDPVYTPHSSFPGLKTFSCLENWKSCPVVELPRLRIEINGLDYLQFSAAGGSEFNSQLRFQQDCFRLWYQVDGTGILQNVTRSTFGTARPGLLGVMERGERHTYLHQKGNFECFQILFSLLPSKQAKCYWNSEIEGKIVLDEKERIYFENLIFDLLLVISKGKEILGLASISRLLEILVVLFKKGLMIVDESRFPKNKVKSLVAKARIFMDLNYSSIQHQRSLEQECGVDVNYLNIIFKKETGKTLYQYITGVRMEHAKYLLETTGDSISDIADKVGYPNGNSFSRAFKRQENCGPLEFRSRHQCMESKTEKNSQLDRSLYGPDSK